MTQRLRNNFVKLSALASPDPKLRESTIQRSDDELINVVSECIRNHLANKLKFTAQERRRLRKFKHLCRKIHSKKVSIRKKRMLLLQNQTGGFLPALLAPILGIVGSLIGGLVN